MSITIIDSIMGAGKTSWVIQEILNEQLDRNILYVTPRLDDIEDVMARTTRTIYQPENKGSGKLGNIVSLLSNSCDIASTHELFRRFDERCKRALKENHYTLVMDETLSAVEQFKFEKKDDFKSLLNDGKVKVHSDGLIEWTGNQELETRFDDVKILANNQCLFKVDDKFFLWHFPHELFALFDNVYVLTYNFSGSILRYYFDLYKLDYEYKSICKDNAGYSLVDYYAPDLSPFRKRFALYEGTELLSNISQKQNMLSHNWCDKAINRENLNQLQCNMYNYIHNKINARSQDVMWTTFNSARKQLARKGYARGFLPCNARGTNRYSDKTTLMYCVNWYTSPEIEKFFTQHGITIDQDAIALNSMIQWIWRSNIRVADSDKTIHLYIPSPRMRGLFKDWLSQKMECVPATLHTV